MKPAAALFALLVPFIGACGVASSPPPTDGAQPPPPPPTTNAAPTTTTPPPTVAPTPTSPPPTPTATAMTGTSTPPKSEGKGTASNLIGRWVSPSCGTRTYVRKIAFAPGATFDATDLVSPCPPKAQCIWSGIVTVNGTYTVESGMIKLTLAQPGGNAKAQPLPASLALDPVSGAPIETGSGGKCVYTKDTSQP